MKDKRIRLLSTRPLDEALIENAAFQNITLESLDFIEIQKMVTEEVAEEIKHLAKLKAIIVFTSMNAVETVVDVLPTNAEMPDWTIYCLGGATFTLVKKYWNYNKVAFTARNATDLALRIADDKITEITFFCGNKRREELPELLKTKDIFVKELVVYETLETPVKVEQEYAGILFFSPSAVKSFFSDNKIPSETTLFAIGNTTAAAIKEYTNNKIIVSEFPAKDQLVVKAIDYYNNNKS